MIKISENRLNTLLSAMANTNVLVIGDVMIDEYMWGDVQRISPEAPVPVVDVENVTLRLGGASNVVQNLKTIGANPYLLSVCGNDLNGDRFCKLLEKQGCLSDYIFRSDDRPTTIKTRILAKQQQIVRADREVCMNLSTKEQQALLSMFDKLLPNVNAIIISDYGKGVICPQLLSIVIEKAQKLGIFCAIDPKDRHFELYCGVSVITPNLKEAHAAFGIPNNLHISDHEIEELGWNIINKYDIAFLLLTLSERGMALFNKDSQKIDILPTVAKRIFDVTGAGDTVISIFTAAMAAGSEPIEAAFIANHAAGITIAELGTASVDPKSLILECITE